LAASKTITSLDLTGNLIGIAAVQALAENTTLTTLGLGRSEIARHGLEGLEALAASTLDSLDVSGNKLDSAVLCMLLTRTKLRVLDATLNACEPQEKNELIALAACMGVTLRI